MITTVAQLITELEKMPREAGLYLTYNAEPGSKILAHQVLKIDSLKLCEVQYLPVDDPFNLIIEVEIGVKPEN